MIIKHGVQFLCLKGMIESLTHGNTKGWTYMGMNAMLGLLGTKLFVTKTVGELISGIK